MTQIEEDIPSRYVEGSQLQSILEEFNVDLPPLRRLVSASEIEADNVGPDIDNDIQLERETDDREADEFDQYFPDIGHCSPPNVGNSESRNRRFSLLAPVLTFLLRGGTTMPWRFN